MEEIRALYGPVESLITEAGKRGDLENVKVLYKFNPSKEEILLTYLNAHKGKHYHVKELLEDKYPSLDNLPSDKYVDWGENHLHSAITNIGNPFHYVFCDKDYLCPLEGIIEMIKWGSDVNFRATQNVLIVDTFSTVGQTPLITTLRSTDILGIFNENFEVDPNVKLELVRVLIKAGAYVNVRHGRFEFTPLHFATRGLEKDIAKELIESGAYVNAKDYRGQTPLDHLSHRCMVSSWGENEEAWGEKNLQKEMFSYLKSQGAVSGGDFSDDFCENL